MKRLEEENSSLKAEVERLKKQLVTMEIKNGGITVHTCSLYMHTVPHMHHMHVHIVMHTLKYQQSDE